MSKQPHADPHTAALRATMGPRLKSARNALDITQEEAAELIGISAEFYARMERGNALPSVETLNKLAAALQVTSDYLLGADQAARKLGATLPLIRPEDPKQMNFIVERARGDTELTRLLIALLKLCARYDEEDATEDPDEDSGEDSDDGPENSD